MKVKPELPHGFVKRIKEEWGDEAEEFLAALEGEGPVSLRVNPKKAGAEFEGATEIPWAKYGLFLSDRPKFIRDPLIQTGAYYVQEASSMIISQLLPREEGMHVLDLCAAPGGKSTLLATLIGEGSLLVSNEIVGKRAVILEENVMKWGYSNVVVTNNRPRDFAKLTHFFDVIVIDAPCSGEGMFRKDPAVRETWSPRIVEQCAARQKQILEDVYDALTPGGIIIYSTCTFNQRENEEVLDWAVENLGLEIGVSDLEFPEDWGLQKGPKGHRCIPGKFQGEGFFFSILEKKGEKSKTKRTKQRINQKPLKEIDAFLTNPDQFLPMKIGERTHAIPEAHYHSITAFNKLLRVRTAGVPLGTFNREKFIPDHGLALSIHLSEGIQRAELDYEEAIRYFKREPIPVKPGLEKGWAIVTYKNLALGWVKVLPNRMNNHLPKNWRIRADISDWDMTHIA